jgi:hypothetical protein
MNKHQFRHLVKEREGLDVAYWDPDFITVIYREKTQNSTGDASYKTAMLALFENEPAFEARITGQKVDSWLSAQTFAPILSAMILVMEDVIAMGLKFPDEKCLAPKQWQHDLLARLKSFQS